MTLQDTAQLLQAEGFEQKLAFALTGGLDRHATEADRSIAWPAPALQMLPSVQSCPLRLSWEWGE